jgi:hypothetical protein
MYIFFFQFFYKMTDKEIIELSKKNYENLPEVKSKKEEEKKNQWK